MVEGKDVCRGGVICGVGGSIGSCLWPANLDAVSNCPQPIWLVLELDGCFVGAFNLSTPLMKGDCASGVTQGPCSDKGFVHIGEDVCLCGLMW